MMVSTPGEIPEYELNPGELQFRKGDEVLTVSILIPNFCWFSNVGPRTEI